jgi:hypothetical protein
MLGIKIVVTWTGREDRECVVTPSSPSAVIFVQCSFFVPQYNNETMILKKCSLLASYQWLPYIYHHLMIKLNEMGGACSTYGGEERCVQGFGGET